jgi:hypothetical protein
MVNFFRVSAFDRYFYDKLFDTGFNTSVASSKPTVYSAMTEVSELFSVFTFHIFSFISLNFQLFNQICLLQVLSFPSSRSIMLTNNIHSLFQLSIRAQQEGSSLQLGASVSKAGTGTEHKTENKNKRARRGGAAGGVENVED